MTRHRTPLTELARLGFAELGETEARLEEWGDASAILPALGRAADPDLALRSLLRLRERAPDDLAAVLDSPDAAERLITVLGASEGLGDFLHRRPGELASLQQPLARPWSADEYTADLVASVDGLSGEPAHVALRVRYRRHLTRLAAWDLQADDATAVLDRVAEALADLAGAALEASLAVARRDVRFSAEQVAATRLAVIGMGKAGARELNYVSDVDVIFVVEGESDGDETGRTVEIGTRLAMLTMRGIHDLAAEPELWEVDANLRPEGKAGALVRTLPSHVAYYERWAKGWEFQALLKSRPMAGDLELGARYRAALEPMVWASASRENFVEDVQRMRERVTEHIPADEVDVQLKLGPGGLRDIEFTVQLLQLVHGQQDDAVRERDSIGALAALAENGYIGRQEAGEFSHDYRFLRVLEHRIQLRRLRRTHLMPRTDDELRVLARASGLAGGAADLVARWQTVKKEVRSLHERLFYRPLLSAVAALPDEGFALTSEQATARLAAIGFHDPKGALAHIAALTGGVSRRSTIQRALLPVMLQWFAEGPDPDFGLLTFRSLSEKLGESHWFLRMLRDTAGAAQRLTQVLSGSRFASGILDRIPEATAWLQKDDELVPRSRGLLLDEALATVARHDDVDAAASVLRRARQREILRLAIAAIVADISIEALGPALADITTAILAGALQLSRRPDDGIEFAVVAMGRYGGAELGFGSDADVMYVYRALEGTDPQDAQKNAERIVRSLARLTEDLRVPLDLDVGLRPEGRNGPVVRSLDSYRAYYARWSLTWEAQALLRATPVVGDESLMTDVATLIDEVRYPSEVPEKEAREIRRIKARVESERLPQGADPQRHLKLGRGSLSDVEWLVQLLQLQHAARHPALRTVSTLGGLDAAVDAGLLAAADARRLRAAWMLASRVRSAMVLWSGKTADVLPSDRRQLDAVGRILGYPPVSASELEEDYLRATRQARQVFERVFYA